MFDKLRAIEERYEKLLGLVSGPNVQANPTEYRTHTKALSELTPLVEKFREYKAVVTEVEQARELIQGDDPELRELAEQEVEELEARREMRPRKRRPSRTTGRENLSATRPSGVVLSTAASAFR